LGRYKVGRVPFSEEERIQCKEIANAISKAENMHKQKVLQDMAQYRKNRARLAAKAREAKERGLSYGYYVALCIEFRGRLSIM
jgi:hypothetical protein